MRYLACPDCGKRAVYLKSKPGEGDVYLCRTRDCDFFTWIDDRDKDEAAKLTRLLAANPEE